MGRTYSRSRAHPDPPGHCRRRTGHHPDPPRDLARGVRADNRPGDHRAGDRTPRRRERRPAARSHQPGRGRVARAGVAGPGAIVGYASFGPERTVAAWPPSPPRVRPAAARVQPGRAGGRDGGAVRAVRGACALVDRRRTGADRRGPRRPAGGRVPARGAVDPDRQRPRPPVLRHGPASPPTARPTSSPPSAMSRNSGMPVTSESSGRPHAVGRAVASHQRLPARQPVLAGG